MKRYEGMFLINPELDEEKIEKEIETVKSEIIKEKGEIEESKILGRRKMAYSIKKQDHAVFVLMFFKADEQVIDKVRRKYHLNQNILRELIFIKDKKLPLDEIRD